MPLSAPLQHAQPGVAGPMEDMLYAQVMCVMVTKAKDAGNNMFRAQDYIGAIAAYSEYLTDDMTDEFICHRGWMQAAASGMPDANELFNILGQTLNNRAMCNLKLSNMRAVLIDTAMAMHITCFPSLLVAGVQSGPLAGRQIRPGAEEIFFKACVRRSNAFEATGNSASAAQLIRDVSLSVAAADLSAYSCRLDSMRHPSVDGRLACRGKVDWSAVCTARWTQRRAGGEVPPELKGFGAGHHGGSIYIVGGNVFGQMVHNSKVYALDLSSMTWRVVEPRGPRDAHPPPGHMYFSNAIWRSSICNVVFRDTEAPAVHLFDMATETWSKRSCAEWPKNAKSFPWAQRGERLREFAMAVLGNKLYIYGGYTNGLNMGSPACLFAYSLADDAWEVIHKMPGTSQSFPSGRHGHQMWAMSGKLFILGGRTPAPTASVNEPMVPEERYFWSYDIAARTWRNEASFMNGRGKQGNTPCPRSGFSVATYGSGGGGGDTSMMSKAIIFGGYSTELKFVDHQASLEMYYTNLGDTFLFDAQKKMWNYVFTDHWPEHRAMAALIAVPIEAIANPDTSSVAQASAGAAGAAGPETLDDAVSSRSSSRDKHLEAVASRKGAMQESGAASAPDPADHAIKMKSRLSKNMEGSRMFALGGYDCHGNEASGLPFGSVWELVLGSSVKHIKARCWGCDKFDEGLKLCCGTCEGAVATCGKECQAKVWASGHKHWCSKKAVRKEDAEVARKVPTEIEKIVAKLSSPTASEQLHAAQAMINFASREAGNQVKICGAPGVLTQLVVLLSSSSVAVQEVAAGALWCLACNLENHAKLRDAPGVITQLVAVLSSSSVAVQLQATGTLGTLAHSKDIKVKLGAAPGAITQLVALLSSSSAELQRNASGALFNLAHNMENTVKIAAVPGAITQLATLLSSSSLEVQETAAGAICTLAVNMDNHVKIAAARGAITQLVALLSSNSEAARERAAGALHNLAANTENKVRIGAAPGAITQLVALLPSSPALTQEMAVGALASLAFNQDNGVKIVAAHGAITHVAALLSSSSVGVREKAGRALLNLAANVENGIKIAAAPNAITQLVVLLGSSSVAGQDIAARALCNLATNNAANQVKIGTTPGALAQLRKMARSSDRGSKMSASRALSLLT